MHAQRVVLTIAAGLGMLCTFLPWLNVPIFGAVYGTHGDGWISFVVCAGALVCAIVGDLKSELSLGALITSVALGCVACLVALWDIINFNTSAAGSEFGDLVSIGVGLYLLVPAGAAIAVLPALVQIGRRVPQPPPPQTWPAPPSAGPSGWSPRPPSGPWSPYR